MVKPEGESFGADAPLKDLGPGVGPVVPGMVAAVGIDRLGSGVALNLVLQALNNLVLERRNAHDFLRSRPLQFHCRHVLSPLVIGRMAQKHQLFGAGQEANRKLDSALSGIAMRIRLASALSYRILHSF